jgi:hypothetical protein
MLMQLTQTVTPPSSVTRRHINTWRDLELDSRVLYVDRVGMRNYKILGFDSMSSLCTSQHNYKYKGRTSAIHIDCNITHQDSSITPDGTMSPNSSSGCKLSLPECKSVKWRTNDPHAWCHVTTIHSISITNIPKNTFYTIIIWLIIVKFSSNFRVSSREP